MKILSQRMTSALCFSGERGSEKELCEETCYHSSLIIDNVEQPVVVY